MLHMRAMFMFAKFHLTFNSKSKVSCDVFKNKNECQLTYTFNSQMSPQFWVTQYFRKTNILNYKLQSSFVTKKKLLLLLLLLIERNYPLVLHVSPNVDNSPIHSIHFEPTKRDPHKSLNGLQVQPIVQKTFDCILFGNSSLTNSYT